MRKKRLKEIKSSDKTNEPENKLTCFQKMLQKKDPQKFNEYMAKAKRVDKPKTTKNFGGW